MREQTTLRLPPALKKVIQEMAEQHGVSMNAYIIQALWTLVGQESGR